MTVDQLEACLRGFLDFFPYPKTWGGELQARAASQRPVGYSGRVRCRACGGQGRQAKEINPCRECKGTGGWEFDPYVGKLFGEEQSPPPLRARLRERETTGDKQLDALADGRERRDEVPACRQVVAMMGELHPGMRALLVWTYVLNGQAPTRQALDGLDALAVLVADVRAPGWVLAGEQTRKLTLALAKGNGAARNAQRQRDDAIRADRQAGLSSASIATRYGVTPRRVQQLTRPT